MINMIYVFSSVELFMCESVLFLVFAAGFWWCLGHFACRLRAFPGVTAPQLRRWALFQVVFVAAWSVLFKLGFPPVARVALDRGGSQIFANAAEFVFTLFVLAGCWLVIFNSRRLGELVGRRLRRAA